jgi:hypothetical protein
MEQIAKLVKESAEGAKQSAQACQDLSRLALDLRKMVSSFKLGSDGSFGAGHRASHASSKRLSTHEEPLKVFAARAR